MLIELPVYPTFGGVEGAKEDGFNHLKLSATDSPFPRKYEPLASHHSWVCNLGMDINQSIRGVLQRAYRGPMIAANFR